MKRIFANETVNKIGEKIKLNGWVNTIRDHGKVFFFELRDKSGIVQVVGDNKLKTLGNEDVVEIVGTVGKRPDNMINKDIETGTVEVQIEEFKILAKSKELPFPIDSDGREINEEVRLKYRYVDLKRKRLTENIRLRSEFVQKCRQFLFDKGFCEIETPYLTQSTPEGSRDFIVPARLQPGKFFALPQSPQQYKQLLMGAGFENYFQIARCFRDEDLRADRGFEHTQIDIEASFVTREEVMALDEEMITTVVESLGYKLKQKPFPRISYKEAMEKYGDDKFDMRTEEDKKNGVLAFAWVVDFPFFKKTEGADEAEVATAKGSWTFTHNPFSQPSEETLENHMKGENIESIMTQQYDLVCNGFEVGGGSIRANRPEVLKATYKIMGYSEEEIEESVGHMIKAFSYGAPPHGGLAHGVERLLMILAGETALREVVAFPQTASGTTAITNAPTEIPDDQLKELGIKVRSAGDVSGTQAKLDCFGRICAFLNEEKAPYQTFFHEPTKTSEESAQVRNTPLEQGAKALIVNADGQKLMFVISASSKLNLNAIKKDLGYKNVSLISLAELEELTGLKPGAIPPFGSLFGVKTYMGEKLAGMENVSFNAGANDKSIQMKTKDFIAAEKVEVGNFEK